MTEEIINRIQAIARLYGLDHQRIKAIEELSELIQALAKNDKESICEEMADVIVMILQIIYLYELDGLEKVIKNKVTRQERRIAIEEYICNEDCMWK